MNKVLIGILIAIVALIIFLNYQQKIPLGEKEKSFEETVSNIISEDNLNVCKQDSDCIYVPYDHCCTSFRAINKMYLKEYNNQPEWQGVERETCIDIPCGATVPFEDIDVESSKCIDNYDSIVGNSRCI